MRSYLVDGNPVLIDSDSRAEELFPGRWTFVRDVAPPPVARRITKLAFRNRFTRAEKAAIELAAIDNPAATMPQRQQAAAIRADLADQAQATFIDLDRKETRDGVVALEAAGLLAVGRAAQILDAPVVDTERPE
jgi:hypothetical protein